jgi:prenyltransferase beta subunit
MKPITDRLIQTAALSRRVLEQDSRDRIGGFIMAHQDPDGGFRGRGEESGLRSTLFAVGCLKALGDPVPVLKLRKYIRSFRAGDGLDAVELVCLIRLREAFRMSGFTRRRLLRRLEQLVDESVYGLFLRQLAAERATAVSLPEEPLRTAQDDPTAALAVAVLLNPRIDESVVEKLRGRAVDTGGFMPTDQVAVPDLLSTAAALFALTSSGASQKGIEASCSKFVESLWCDSGGFAGRVDDEAADAESTFYALLSIGSIVHSMAKERDR